MMIMELDHADPLMQYKRVFAQFDENRDGKISPAELRQCLGWMGCELREGEAEAAVDSMDSDGDGFLELEDFVRLMEGAGEEERMQGLRDAFRMYGMDDGSDCITAVSLRRMLEKLGQSNNIHECQLMIRRYDIDGDGVLNFHEFKVMMSSL